MKTTNNAVLLAMASLAAQAAAQKVQMEVRYTDNLIDVGNVDIFNATWQTLYDTVGNERAIMTDRSFGADNKPCTHETDTDADLTVRVRMNGAWGQTPGLEQNQMRDALVQSLWEVLRNVADKDKYDVFTGCYGTSWVEGPKYDAAAACGPKSAVSCEGACKDENTPTLAQCMTHSQAHRVPSSLRVTAYIDGRLQPDDLIVEFDAKSNAQAGGCGWVGEIAKAVSGFIPVAGGLFQQGIDVGCAE